jgi:hypothetical protein
MDTLRESFPSLSFSLRLCALCVSPSIHFSAALRPLREPFFSFASLREILVQYVPDAFRAAGCPAVIFTQ